MSTKKLYKNKFFILAENKRLAVAALRVNFRKQKSVIYARKYFYFS